MNSEDYLTLETYGSNGIVQDKSFYKYIFCSINIEIDSKKNLNKTVYALRKNNKDCRIYAEKGMIFSDNEISNIDTGKDAIVSFDEYAILPVLEHKELYAKYLKDSIQENLGKVLTEKNYRKYSVKRDNISSGFFEIEGKNKPIKDDKQEIGLRRNYEITVEIGEDKKAYLTIYTHCSYSPKKRIYDLINEGRDVCGIKAKYEWGDKSQSVEIVGISKKTVADKISETECSIKDYLISTGKGKFINGIEDTTKVIEAKFSNNNKTFYYYPQSLKPICNREYVAKNYPKFSKDTSKYMKLNMNQRNEINKKFIKDIGVIKEVNNLSFNDILSPDNVLNYKELHLEPEKLICNNDKEIQYNELYKAFNYGFFKKNKTPLRIGYIYPEPSEDYMGAVANTIYDFANNGKFHGEEDKYTYKGLLNIDANFIKEHKMEAKIKYDPNDYSSYNDAINKLSISGANFAIIIVPSENDEDVEDSYSSFKKRLVEENIPSQIITMKTAELFKEETTNTTSKYYLQNIIPGILGKAGGIPWIVKNMPGSVDMFVGIDIATIEAGIHFPACSVVFDKNGELLGYYKPKNPQSGEKIGNKLLKEIFEKVIAEYKNKYNIMPKNIVIHRDGFSNEDSEWYDSFFREKGINYNIVEVRKNIYTKMAHIKNGCIQNPKVGDCLYNEKLGKAYLVTTFLYENLGSPSPILIEKKCGNLDTIDIIKQILNLSLINASSTHKSRLPVTTYYADKICKHREFVPSGNVSTNLFFL